MEFMIEPIERSQYVFALAVSMIVLALAEAGAAKVETQHGKSEAVQGFHGMEDNFVVQSSAKNLMRMAGECGMRGMVVAGIEQGFEASCGAFEK